MFCIKCGTKLPDGAKFCLQCGANLSNIIDNIEEEDNYQNQTIKENVDLDNYKDESKEIELLKRKYIKEIFAGVFNDSRVFGDQLYIIGKNRINQEIKENLYEYYLEKDEEPLLIFDYDKKGLSQGFVITDRRFIWCYSKGKDYIDLEDIKDVLAGKRILATVIQFVDFDNVEYPDIYLTGIRNEDKFIAKMRKFVDEIYYTFNEPDEQNDEQIDEQVDMQHEIEKLIVYACQTVDINSMYCVVGNPEIDLSSKKYSLAKKYFNIPDEEKIFFIFDATVFGGCEKGFALCSTGFYYCQSRRGYLDWNQFSKQNISYGLGGLKCAGEIFSTGTDGKKISIILNTIIENLC